MPSCSGGSSRQACGKTATARQLAASEVLLDVDAQARQAVLIDPALLLRGKVPRLLDEWQLEPLIWNHVRRAVDDRGRPGQFLLTGSAVPTDDIVRHTGAGRITRLRMRPMSLYETGHASGRASMETLLHGRMEASGDNGPTVTEIAERTAVGGWPGLIDLNVKQSLQMNRDYVDEIRRVDLGRVEQRAYDPLKVGQLLRSLARHVATYTSVATLAKGNPDSGEPIKDDTARTYLEALERLMVVENQPAWGPHLRAKSRVRSAPKRHFVDPSLAIAALRATPERLLADLKLFGFLFESLVVRDLRIYAQANDAEVLQYRDNTGLEVDAIVEAADGRWAAFEIKLGVGMIEEAAANLLKFATRVDTEQCGPPSLLGVIVATGYGYVRKDGVAVIPIGTLGP
jgi:predicted AAA+ superfamily ATPase